MRSATCAEIRSLDERAEREFAIPTLLLMENAGRGATDALAPFLEPGGVPVVVCGKGNNGGDGFVIARHLHNRGFSPRVFLLASRGSIDPATDPGVNLEILARMGVPVVEIDLEDLPVLETALGGADLVIDALLGTGLAGSVRSPYAETIRAINRSGRPIVAVDTPSGLDADRGEVLGEAVQASRTVTFGLPKVGFERGEGPRYCGEVVLVDISIPRQLLVEEPS